MAYFDPEGLHVVLNVGHSSLEVLHVLLEVEPYLVAHGALEKVYELSFAPEHDG